jgi:hypothetical protein
MAAMTIIWLLLGCLAIFLITRAWFWCFSFFLIALASFFLMLASIIHFQILGAMGFFFAAVISWGIMLRIAEKKYS